MLTILHLKDYKKIGDSNLITYNFSYPSHYFYIQFIRFFSISLQIGELPRTSIIFLANSKKLSFQLLYKCYYFKKLFYFRTLFCLTIVEQKNELYRKYSFSGNEVSKTVAIADCT